MYAAASKGQQWTHVTTPTVRMPANHNSSNRRLRQAPTLLPRLLHYCARCSEDQQELLHAVAQHVLLQLVVL
jgi:hypothetical protein